MERRTGVSDIFISDRNSRTEAFLINYNAKIRKNKYIR